MLTPSHELVIQGADSGVQVKVRAPRGHQPGQCSHHSGSVGGLQGVGDGIHAHCRSPLLGSCSRARTKHSASATAAMPSRSAAWRTTQGTSKRDLIAALEIPVQQGRFKLPARLPLGDVLRRELAGFKLRLKPKTGHAQIDIKRAGEGHGDLVIAVALACVHPDHGITPRLLEPVEDLIQPTRKETTVRPAPTYQTAIINQTHALKDMSEAYAKADRELGRRVRPEADRGRAAIGRGRPPAGSTNRQLSTWLM